MPFVLYSQPTGVFDGKGFSQGKAQEEAHRRYSEILRDVEFMIDDYSKCGRQGCARCARTCSHLQLGLEAHIQPSLCPE